MMEQIYSDPKAPGSFGGVEKLRRSVKKLKNIELKQNEVQEWLKKKDTYTKYRTARRKFKRNPIIAGHIDAQWQGDLAEVGNLASYNDGIRYLLILIDIVSKFVWVEPLSSKSGPVVQAGFANIFKRTKRRPEKLQTDDGKEFLFKGVQAFLKINQIGFFTVKSDKKAAVAERVVRTIKEKIWRYMHEKHTKTYLPVLQDLVTSYNHTYHKSIGMSPEEVTEHTEAQVLRKLYGKAWSDQRKLNKPKLKAGDFVRISSIKGPFQKGYMGNWSEEVFIVHKVFDSGVKVTYKICDMDNEVLEGTFYEHEIQQIYKDMEGYWKVEKILKTRKLGQKTQYLVKWEGFPENMNSWVNEKDIKSITQTK